MRYFIQDSTGKYITEFDCPMRAARFVAGTDFEVIPA
jgi:hypothetical protein